MLLFFFIQRQHKKEKRSDQHHTFDDKNAYYWNQGDQRRDRICRLDQREEQQYAGYYAKKYKQKTLLTQALLWL